jgi:hypothetical protein
VPASSARRLTGLFYLDGARNGLCLTGNDLVAPRHWLLIRTAGGGARRPAPVVTGILMGPHAWVGDARSPTLPQAFSTGSRRLSLRPRADFAKASSAVSSASGSV